MRSQLSNGQVLGVSLWPGEPRRVWAVPGHTCACEAAGSLGPTSMCPGVPPAPPVPCAAVCADLDTAEAGDACRQAELSRDEGVGYKGNYSKLTSGPESEYP